VYLLDTNIFLEILLDQQKSEFCQKAIENLREDTPGWITSFSLHAIEAILWKYQRAKILEDFLEFVKNHPFLFCYATTVEEELEINRIAPRVGLDFDDALQYYVAKKKGCTLVTLDKDFEKIKDVRIMTP
jgi:predicted nucleic acid-binding protein